VRYGGRGVMIYWHVEHKATCIYSQLKTCSSSEVAAMIEGVLRHCTEIIVNKQYVDSHGQSEVASFPIMIGLVPVALVLGAQGTQKGFGVLEVPLMTGFNFAGGSEFAALKLWTSPPDLLLILAITFLVNSRHILMGAALAPLIKCLPRPKVLPALF
jgi:AzlC protein/Tn3 transposase DDE domain